jgi:hypothetical protein
MCVTEKNDVCSVRISARGNPFKTVFYIIKMSMGHKYLLAFKFNCFGALRAVSAIGIDPTVVFSVALDDYEGLIVIVGQKFGEVAGTVAEVNYHIGIGTKL